MVTLTIDNSYCQIDGLELSNFKGLRSLLSYQVSPQQLYYTGNPNTIRYLMDRKGIFPSGLLEKARKYLELNKILYREIDTRRVPETLRESFRASIGVTPYQEQIDAVNASKRFSRGTIVLPTGVGKSLTAAMLVNQLQVKTLIVVPNLGLKHQLTETFKKIFGDLKNITIENIDSPKLKTLTDFDALIIDESHHVAASTYRKLNKRAWTGIYYRYFFTATPFRSQDEEQMLMESISGQVIYKLSYDTAVQKGYIVPVEAYYIELEPSPCEATTWKAVYSKLIVNNAVRNQIITDLLLKLHKAKISTLCLVKELAHGETLSSGGAFPFVNGEDQETKKYIEMHNNRKFHAMIGTVGVLGEGVDTRPAEYVIIAGLGKAKSQFMQNVGRGVRSYPGKESCKVILIKDKSHKFTLRHFKAQCSILEEEYGVKPIKLEL